METKIQKRIKRIKRNFNLEFINKITRASEIAAEIDHNNLDNFDEYNELFDYIDKRIENAQEVIENWQ